MAVRSHRPTGHLRWTRQLPHGAGELRCGGPQSALQRGPREANAVLGRPALVKFMAAVHYAYLQMKMPGPGGPITVHGDLQVALACMEQHADQLAAASKPEGGDERLSASVPAAPRQRMITC